MVQDYGILIKMWTTDLEPIVTPRIGGHEFPRFPTDLNPEGWWFAGLAKEQAIPRRSFPISSEKLDRGMQTQDKGFIEDSGLGPLPNTIIIKGETQVTTDPKTAWGWGLKMFQPYFEKWQPNGLPSQMPPQDYRPSFPHGVRV